jgi:hypothetical protein
MQEPPVPRDNVAFSERVDSLRTSGVSNIRIGVRAPTGRPGSPFEPSIVAVLVERSSGRSTLFVPEDPTDELLFLSDLPLRPKK